MLEQTRPARPTADLVAGFTEGFVRRVLTGHGVVSGLGVWLLLALVAQDAPPAARAVLEEALGTDAEDAAARAAALLDQAHPEVRHAVAVWVDQTWSTPAFDQWATRLPGSVARGPMPTQEQADAWTAERTLGLVQRFPADLSPSAVQVPAVVLASAVATKICWDAPFDEAYVFRPEQDDHVPETLGGAFSHAAEVLSTPPSGHQVGLADTAAAGRVAVHAARSEGLRVLSVIAEPDCPVGNVHQAALEVARSSLAIDLFGAPLGTGHAWTLTERTASQVSDSDRTTETRALLPAWDATTCTSLRGEPWFPAVAATGNRWVTEPKDVDGQQQAVASYDRLGFSAAAVTDMPCWAASLVDTREVRLRRLEVRFDRPYAVVAVACPPPSSQLSAARPRWWRRSPNRADSDRTLTVDGTTEVSPWDGIPVFSAWVAEPRTVSR
ncbi:MAG: hypothetical protein FWH11_13480 [Micrococcales bacterium]|nr:hypothetical protein [Micrococcales bacterium]